MRGITGDVDRSVIDDVQLLRYQDRRQLTTPELEAEPYWAIYKAMMIWSLDNDRDMLEIERQKNT